MKKYNLDNKTISNLIYSHKFISLNNIQLNNKVLIQKQEENYLNLMIALENIPPCFSSTKKNIKQKLDTYIKFIDELDYYKNEKFYCTGFNDGYNYLMELLNQEGNDNKWVKYIINILN